MGIDGYLNFNLKEYEQMKGMSVQKEQEKQEVYLSKTDTQMFIGLQTTSIPLMDIIVNL